MVYRPESWWLAIVALVYGWVTSGQFMSQILAEQFVRAAGRKQTRGGNLRSFVLLPTDPGVLCWSFVLWGFGVPFMVLYTFLAVVAVAHSSISLRRRFRDLRGPADARQAPSRGSPVPELSVLLPARNAAGTITARRGLDAGCHAPRLRAGRRQRLLLRFDGGRGDPWCVARRRGRSSPAHRGHHPGRGRRVPRPDAADGAHGLAPGGPHGRRRRLPEGALQAHDGAPSSAATTWCSRR